MKKNALFVFVVGCLVTLSMTGCTSSKVSQGFSGIQGEGPWTDLDVPLEEGDFRFIIVADNTGGKRDGIFEEAVEKINLLQPEFVISVGDLITGYTEDRKTLADEWDEFDAMVRELDAPFFYVPGNHDYLNAIQAEVWAKRYKRSYYHFVYNNVLMLCVNAEERATGTSHMSPEQQAYFKKVLAENRDVRWTFVFMHEPLWSYDEKGKNTGWADVSKALQGRQYTVFAGHFHTYAKYERHDRDYFILATTGGGSGLTGPYFGQFDHVVSVSMTGEEPHIANLMLDGIHDKNIRTERVVEECRALRKQIVVRTETILIEEGMGSVLNSELVVANNSTMLMDFELAPGVETEGPVQLELANDELSLNPGETGRVGVIVHVKEDTPLEGFPLSKIKVTASFTPEGFGRTEVERGVSIGIDSEHACPVLFGGASITVDGSLDDWKDLPYQINRKDQVQYTENWTGPVDCAFSFGVTRDEEYLYVAVKVTDDKVGIDMNQPAFNKDSAAIYVDARPREERMDDLSIHTQFKKHMLFIMAPGETAEAPDIYLKERLPEGTKTACVQTKEGYNAEIALPISYLDTMQAKPWESFRLNVRVSDPDVHGVSKLYWRPYWYSSDDFKDAGTFVK